jgi:hypothetical protein
MLRQFAVLLYNSTPTLWGSPPEIFMATREISLIGAVVGLGVSDAALALLWFVVSEESRR